MINLITFTFWTISLWKEIHWPRIRGRCIKRPRVNTYHFPFHVINLITFTFWTISLWKEIHWPRIRGRCVKRPRASRGKFIATVYSEWRPFGMWTWFFCDRLPFIFVNIFKIKNVTEFVAVESWLSKLETLMKVDQQMDKRRKKVTPLTTQRS